MECCQLVFHWFALSPSQSFLMKFRVVCPLALVAQWADEIQRMTGFKVLKHQGTSRTTGIYSRFQNVNAIFMSNIDANVFNKYHVVVTTYDTVKSEYMAYSPPAKDESKATSKYTSKKSTPDDSEVDSDDDSFGRTIKKKPTSGKKAPVKRCALFELKWWRIVLGIFLPSLCYIC